MEVFYKMLTRLIKQVRLIGLMCMSGHQLGQSKAPSMKKLSSIMMEIMKYGPCCVTSFMDDHSEKNKF